MNKKEERKPCDDNYVYENKLIDKAIITATSAHAGQLRKGTTEPYITHPLQVMSILNEMGADTNLLIAGLLHDAIEDTGMTDEDILRDFGTDVLELVTAHTEDKSKSWEERKQRAINEIPDLPLRAKMLVMADKVANLRSMARDHKNVGEELWGRFNRGKEKICWYYSKAQDALEEMQFYSETRDVYWEMVELFKDLFVSYYYDEERERIIQMAVNGEGYVSGRYMDGARRWEQEIPAGMIEISRGLAERLEDNWEDERGADVVLS